MSWGGSQKSWSGAPAGGEAPCECPQGPAGPGEASHPVHASPRNLRLRLSLGELLAAFFPMKTDEIGTVLTVTGEMEEARVCEWAPPSHGIMVFARLWGRVGHGEI